MYGEAIWASCKRIAAVSNSLREIILGEKRDTKLSSGHSLRGLCLTILVDGLLEWGTGEVSCFYFLIVDDGCGGKGDVLIGRCFGMFTIEGFDYIP